MEDVILLVILVSVLVSPAMSADCLYTGTVSWEKEPKILF